MRQTLPMVVIAILLLLPLGCAPKPVDMAALRTTVDAYNDASKEAMLSGNSDKVMTSYEDDALEMAPNSPVIKGKDNILAFQQQMSKSGMKFNAVSFQTVELTADGKIAYEIGSYRHDDHHATDGGDERARASTSPSGVSKRMVLGRFAPRRGIRTIPCQRLRKKRGRSSAMKDAVFSKLWLDWLLADSLRPKAERYKQQEDVRGRRTLSAPFYLRLNGQSST